MLIAWGGAFSHAESLFIFHQVIIQTIVTFDFLFNWPVRPHRRILVLSLPSHDFKDISTQKDLVNISDSASA